MWKFFSFWWRCIKMAFWGNTAFANDWQWLFGIPAASGLGYIIAARAGLIDISTGNAAADGFLAAFVAFAITWCVPFIVRLFNSPVLLCLEEKVLHVEKIMLDTIQAQQTNSPVLLMAVAKTTNKRLEIIVEYSRYVVAMLEQISHSGAHHIGASRKEK